MNFRSAVFLVTACGVLIATACEAGNSAAPFPKSGPLQESAPNISSKSANPYAIIVERNMFALRPVPPPPEPEVQKPDLPDIKISGFITIAHRRHALFAEVPKNPKEHWTFFNLAEGEREGILELLKISPDEKEAEIVNSGTRVTLTVEDNGFKSSPPAKTAPGGPNLRQRALWHPSPPNQPVNNYSPPRKRM
jgi:hypothetical protein